jgi:hypothetical protein
VSEEAGAAGAVVLEVSPELEEEEEDDEPDEVLPLLSVDDFLA